MDEEELNSFIDRLRNVADEPKARKPKAKPYPTAVKKAGGEDWGGEGARPSTERASSPTSNESLAELNTLTAIKVIFKDGREVVTTVQKLDDVIAEEKESRRRASRRVGA